MFILPVNRDVSPSTTPVISSALVIINSLVWLGLTLTGFNETAIQSFGLHPVHWTMIALFTHMFLHSGFWHIAGNMWFLWMFAPKLEERQGKGLFLFAYLICGIGAASLHTLLNLQSEIPMVGASGAISGVAGMYFVLFPRSPFSLQIYLGWWRIKSFDALTRSAVGVWIGEQFLLGLITTATQSVSIAFWAHVGGFVSGLLVAVGVALRATPAEKEEILRPSPLSEEEKEELFADRIEQPSGLTTLNLKE
jgi:membrane associated rhomboid family serine protease